MDVFGNPQVGRGAAIGYFGIRSYGSNMPITVRLEAFGLILQADRTGIGGSFWLIASGDLLATYPSICRVRVSIS